jgi:hypothetical protein
LISVQRLERVQALAELELKKIEYKDAIEKTTDTHERFKLMLLLKATQDTINSIMEELK